MSPEYTAIALSGVSLVGTLVNLYLKLQISLSMERMEKRILDAIGKEYVRKEVLDARCPLCLGRRLKAVVAEAP